jgi:fructokinase
MSGVSNDMFGQKLVGELDESSVKTDFLVRSDHPTTLAFVHLVNGKASYAFYDENTAGRMVQPNDLPRQLPKDNKALFFGGISLAVDPCADTYLEMLLRNANDRLIMVDPNIRANFIADEVQYRARLGKILQHTDILKVSDEDLDWINPSNTGMETKVAQIIEQGPKLILVTLGADGVMAFTRNGLVSKAVSPSVQVMDTVGAGDAFNAGVLTYLARDDALSKVAVVNITDQALQPVLQFATVFASDTVTKQGSNPAWNFRV